MVVTLYVWIGFDVSVILLYVASLWHEEHTTTSRVVLVYNLPVTRYRYKVRPKSFKTDVTKYR